ncbi:hypothetical protein [Pseudacidovorax sp. RU35E]|uniref:hypothetical protein n=1 Tax=Pseudacidovorax sp. RU35E TaxID=1907403 RepID=UPI00117B653C|nr:hypothetical protein [Pseudacidovorax sp. RU35E]
MIRPESAGEDAQTVFQVRHRLTAHRGNRAVYDGGRKERRIEAEESALAGELRGIAMDAVSSFDEGIKAAWEVVLAARAAMPEQGQRRFRTGGKAAEAMVPTTEAVERLPWLPFQQRDTNFEWQATADHRD